jgi:hypothetical protein
MKVRVQITETLQKIVEVEVDNKDRALEIVSEQYGRADIVLTSEDFKDVELEVAE